MASALEQMQSLLTNSQGMQRKAFDAANAAQDEYIGVLSRPRNTNMPALRLAAGLLAPTKSGSFFEGLGKGVTGYADAVSADEDAELDRNSKIAQIKLAKANLMGQFGNSQLALGMKQFELPGQALNYQDDLDELSGESDIPAMPGLPGMPGASGATPAPPISSTVPPAPGGGSPLPPPNANVGSLQDVAQDAQFASLDDGFTGGGGFDVMFGGSGEDDLSFGGMETPQAAPQAAEQPAPQQMAQAPAQTPPQATPQPQQPQMSPQQAYQQQLYNWALQVRALATQNPRRWSRRPSNKFALQQADKIIDDHRQMQSSTAMQAIQQERIRLAQEKAEAAARKDPIDIKRQENDLKRLEEVESAGRGAIKTRNSIENVRAARENLWLGDDWSTGGVKGLLTGLVNNFYDTGKGALDAASGDMRGRVIDAQNSGAISNYEIKIFNEQVPGLGMGKASADWVMDVGDAFAERQQEMAKFYRRYMDEFGTLSGADEQWQNFLKARPVLDRTPEGQPFLYRERAKEWGNFVKMPPGMKPRNAPDSAPGRTMQPITPEEYQNLQRGQKYLHPDGSIRTKQ